LPPGHKDTKDFFIKTFLCAFVAILFISAVQKNVPAFPGNILIFGNRIFK
jgi:hypothetical protein